MICHFLLLEAPIRSCKQFENPRQVSKARFRKELPSQKEPFPAFTARQRNFPRQVQQPGEVDSLQ